MKAEEKEALGFLFLCLAFLFFFILLPVVVSFWISLWQDVAFLPKKFIGLSNYLRLMKDSEFLSSLFFTFLFCLVSVALEMLFGTAVALIVNEKFKLRGILRGIVILPWAIPTVIGARLWQLIYQYQYGVANYITNAFFGVRISWLSTYIGAFFSLVLTDVWKNTPFVAIIILAGLQTIPEDLYHQAKIDGASLIERFTKITLGIIKPVFVVALLFRSIDALRVFDIIYVITQGGPGGSTTSLSLYAYRYFLLGDFGYGCSISVFLFLVTFSLAMLYLKIAKPEIGK